jgi:hypothetical protein
MIDEEPVDTLESVSHSICLSTDAHHDKTSLVTITYHPARQPQDVGGVPGPQSFDDLLRSK